MDALGSNIRVDARGQEVMRILPRLNEARERGVDLRQDAPSSSTGCARSGSTGPMCASDGRLGPATWAEAFAAIAERVSRHARRERIGAIAGDLATVEEMFALKLLMQSLGSPNLDCRQDGAALDPALGRGSYLFNPDDRRHRSGRRDPDRRRPIRAARRRSSTPASASAGGAAAGRSG